MRGACIVDLQAVGCGGMDWIDVTQDREKSSGVSAPLCFIYN